ncbi:2-oxoacid:acceptor oxidoreductase family protein [Thermoproteus tenax]|uniref:pyruvate synthase n=2 Tax=Thermoproteus tenax TaxID=2271 RepID=G4RM54_THETK|nr:2-oxoacid:acceptor oxidoreductase family protein [Thermoproteus tenax]CAF18510.1 putative 2-oxoglutarate synthase, 2-oxoacid-ferredoxin oxidoreductases gamma subunit [Thermoproteus tenax]CCC82649.1 2-oxoacid ferredoxin oxidoreductase, gamma subunit [Thermoproteus tenax Kra 1]
MIEIRFHGRGGQGMVTASQVLATAAVMEGKYAQAFPEFGPERRGAPVKAYLRIDDRPISKREPVIRPDVVVVADPSLFSSENPLEGLKEGGILVVNGVYKASVRTYYVDATSLAMKVLGRAIVNTAMIGAVVKATSIVALESALAALGKYFGGRLYELNAQLVKIAYDQTREL